MNVKMQKKESTKKIQKGQLKKLFYSFFISFHEKKDVMKVHLLMTLNM